MTHYTNIKMRVLEGQKEKIKKVFETNSKYITIRFGLTDLNGNEINLRGENFSMRFHLREI